MIFSYEILYGNGNWEKGIIKADSKKLAYMALYNRDFPNRDFEEVWYNDRYNGPYIISP